jgi:hypothetical protein
VDAFQADPRVYGGSSWSSGTRGPSWGGVAVTPSAPSWGGKSINAHERRRDHDLGDGDRRGPRDGGRRRGRGIYTGVYAPAYAVPYGFLPYGVAQSVVTGQPVPPAAEPETPEGFLRLLVSPREAEVIVDGIVVGTVDDFGGRGEQALPAGPHRIRIEAPGYEAVEFDVRVPVGDTISLRRELTRLATAPHPVAPERGASNQAPAVRKTFYAIPNCYLGDSIPKADALPAGCSLKDLRVLPPQ